MVSPVFKGGYDANVVKAVAPNGEAVAFESLGAFAGAAADNSRLNWYVAHRQSSGWTTLPLIAPASLAPASAPVDFSADLETSLSPAYFGPNFGAALSEGMEGAFLLHNTGMADVATNFELAGGLRMKTENDTQISLSYYGSSPSLSHIVFTTGTLGPLLDEAKGDDSDMYDLEATGESAPSLKLVELNNETRPKPINPVCAPYLGNDAPYLGNSSKRIFNAVADEGREIFFGLDVESGPHAMCTTTTAPSQLFVRLGGSRTIEVSKPAAEECQEVPCPGAASHAPAKFQGASENGRRVFFTTTQPLTSATTGNDLYMAEIGCPNGEGSCTVADREVTSLDLVSRDIEGEAANVQGVVAVAPDGSHVYFVAQGVLNAAPNAQGVVAVKDADNLYVYDSESGQAPTFVGDLCSGPGLSGSAPDTRCPTDLTVGEGQENDSNLWLVNDREAQLAGDGRFLVFATYAQLSSHDTDGAKDVYLYDAQTGTQERASVGERGRDAGGNGEFDAKIVPADEALGGMYAMRGMNSRASDEQGSRVVFSTAEPLVEGAVNGLVNAYEWHKQPGSSEPVVSLVSTGISSEPVSGVVMSPDGRDVFFATSQGLLPQDTDGAFDIYDARLGGGFPETSTPPAPCSGDACQGSLSTPAPLLIPGSLPQAPGENYPPPHGVVKTKKKAKKAKGKHAGKSKKKPAKGSRSSLRAGKRFDAGGGK
ncbi:MAG TPA: hypothetical protein VIJ50_08005 [Solirubrobacteraceae bacterium]